MAPVLLTGASGYLGAAIAAELAQRSVRYDVLPCRLEQLEKNSLRGYQKVIHAAGALRHREHVAIDRSNRVGTERLLAALNGTPELLFISSRAVYGHQPARTCTEDDPVQPADIYGLSKLAAELAVADSGFPHRILRIPRLIGDSPAGIGQGFYAEALTRFLAGETVFRYVPDRLDDSLDVRALARVCADWADDSVCLAHGVMNVSGRLRSLHCLLGEIAVTARRFGGKPIVRDRFAPELPWPYLSDRRFREAGGSIRQRSDTEIAEACCRQLATVRDLA